MANDDYQGYGEVSTAEIQQYLQQIDFPADKRQIVAIVAEGGAPEKVLSLLHTLPEREYDDPVDATEAIGTGGPYEGNRGEERNPFEEQTREG